MINLKLHIFAMTGLVRGNSQWNTEHNKHVNQRKNTFVITKPGQLLSAVLSFRQRKSYVNMSAF